MSARLSESRNWMQFLMDDLDCEKCASKDLGLAKKSVGLVDPSSRGQEDAIIYETPLLVCKSCGEAHISNAVLGVLREQYLYGAVSEKFDFVLYQKRLAELGIEEQWIEENYYYSSSQVSCGFKINTESNGDEKIKPNEEVFYG